ncbi:MAG: ATP-binding protein [Bacteroidia bacterium]
MRIKSKKILAILFPVILGITIIIGVLSYNNNKTFNDTSRLLKHSYVVLDNSNDVYSAVVAIEGSSNSYLFTDDTNSLNDYTAATKSVMLSIDTLKGLTTDDPKQQARIDSLITLVSSQVNFTNNNINLLDSKKFNNDQQLTYVKQNRYYTEKINKILIEIIASENKLLSEREATNKKSVYSFHWVFYTLVFFLFFFTVSVIYLIYHVFHDQELAEAKEKEIRDRIFKISNANPLPTYIIDLETNHIIYANSACEKLFSDRKENIVGKTSASIIVEPHTEFIARARRAVNEGTGRVEAKVRIPGGLVRDMLFTAEPMEIDNKKCHMINVVDISEIKEEEEAMKNALKKEQELGELKSRFVSLASHEFRTPLAAILTSTELIESYQETKLDDKSRKHLNKIHLNVNNMIDLLNDFLSLGRLEEGKTQSNPVNIDLVIFLNGVIDNMGEMAKKGQKIVLKTSGAPEIIIADDKLLRNILNNLLSNAIKYSPEGSEILLSIAFNSQNVSITIRDHGIGIPEKDQQQLFKSFFRAANATNIPGTGLGLNIVKRYIDIMNGSIEFYSKLNEGTSVTVHLPKHPQNTATESTRIPAESESAG